MCKKYERMRNYVLIFQDSWKATTGINKTYCMYEYRGKNFTIGDREEDYTNF